MEPAANHGWWRANRAAFALCAALLGLFYLLSFFAFQTKSATMDEPMHAGAAYAETFEGDFRLNPEDPPLWKYWSMLPHRRGELQLDRDPLRWQRQLEDILFHSEITTRELYQVPAIEGASFVNSSRAMMLIIGALLGAAIVAWSWQLAGATAAAAACTMFCLDPNFLAHAPLLKNDVPLTLLMLGTAWTVWSIGRRARWWNLLLLSLLCAAAATVKFSGLMLGPIIAAMLLARALLPIRWCFLGRELSGRFTRLLAGMGACALAAAVTFVVIWAAYGFRFDPTSIPGAMLNTPAELRNLKATVLHRSEGRLPDAARIEAAKLPLAGRAIALAEDHRLLPQAWLFGLLYTYRTTLLRDAYLLGEYGNTGWWYYFMLAALFKWPIATLAAIVLAFILRFAPATGGSASHGPPARDLPPGADRWTLLCLLIPPGIYALSAVTSNLNLGIRHILPVFPFIYLAIGMVAARVRITWPRAFKPIAAGVAIGLAVESLFAFPHYISFFNAAAHPYRLHLLSDSNFDWGQDLTAVAEWQQSNPSVRLYLGYWGSVDPEYYGIVYTNIPGGFWMNPNVEWPPQQPGVIAISASLLQGTYSPPIMRRMYAPLRDRKPRQIIGDTIYLYDWPLKTVAP